MKSLFVIRILTGISFLALLNLPRGSMKPVQLLGTPPSPLLGRACLIWEQILRTSMWVVTCPQLALISRDSFENNTICHLSPDIKVKSSVLSLRKLLCLGQGLERHFHPNTRAHRGLDHPATVVSCRHCSFMPPLCLSLHVSPLSSLTGAFPSHY